MKQIIVLFFICTFLGCKESIEPTHTLGVKPSKLIALFKASNSNYPNISVHRGGKGLVNYPENCLETLKYVNDSIYAVYEIDVAQTKDGQLVLMHDNSIERTTNGKGLVYNLTYDELKSYNLKDDFGTITPYKIPLFSEVLEWCKSNNVILTVDIKKSVPQHLVIKVIKDLNAEDITIIITHNASEAQSAYSQAPELLLSVTARNHEEFDRLLATKIPIENMLAFTGTRMSEASLFERLHAENIVCILGTLGNLDKQAEARGNDLYKTWKSKGVDIIATNRPFIAFNTINDQTIMRPHSD